MSEHVSLGARGTAARPVFNKPEALSSLKSISYAEVFRHVESELSARLKAEGKTQKRVDNFRTVRNGWMRQFGLSEVSPVGVEFGSGFADALERYLSALAVEGKEAQTIADRKSIIGAYREAWVSLLQSMTAGVLEGDFAQALARLTELSDMAVKVIARDAGVGAKTFFDWRYGLGQPTKRFLPAVHRLEEIFGVPIGVLAAKLPKVLFGDSGSITRGLTGYRKHLGAVSRLQYLLKEFSPMLQGEWDDVFLFYTDPAWLRTRGLKRNSKWRVREHDNANQ